MRRFLITRMYWPLGLFMFSFLSPPGFAADVANEDADAVFARFHDWVETYLKNGAEARINLLPHGRKLAEARAPLFKELVQKSPVEALERTVSMEKWKQLPLSIQERIERPFSGRGLVRVLVIDDFERGVARQEKRLVIGSRTYRLFLAVPEAEVPINRPLQVKGFLISSIALLTEVKPLN